MLRLILGPSGAGKSNLLRREIIEKSIAAPEDHFLIIVPDQFTMQTQSDMVRAHPDGAIMNIDVLSFGRLTHRIFDTVGQPPFADRILDDTGKSLILRKIALRHEQDLPLLGANMRKAGFIDEVKSVISEFMQYGIGADGIDALKNVCGTKKILAQKLSELQFLYQKFLEEIAGSYMTTEERLDLLCDALPKSPLVRDAVVVFDGFTGFTPIQYRVIRQLLCLAREVIFTFTTDTEAECAEQDLFYLSYKTITDLRRIAKDAGVSEAPVTMLNTRPVMRLQNAPMLARLEQELFRYRAKQTVPEEAADTDQAKTQIRIFTAENPQEEVREVFLRIYDLVRKEGCAYRDIAVIAGSLASYADAIERTAAQFQIPVFIDRTSTLHLNPFTEYLKAALKILSGGFRTEQVLHFLRTGFADMSDEEIDHLETYTRATGVRYRKGWEETFVRHIDPGHPDAEFLARMNDLRLRFLDHIAPLLKIKTGSANCVTEFTQGLREMISIVNAEEKLADMAASFADAGDAVREKEYAHVLEKTLALLDQIEHISGEEKMTVREFYELLSVGMGEFVTGTIPLSVDRVVAGDMERTRLKEVRHLFFLGVDDSAIPKEVTGTGLLSGFDRQFLSETIPEVELAPTPRQLMYMQRLYLYMNLTKPSHTLTLSYAAVDAEGKSLRPAYLIHTLREMFPSIHVETSHGRPFHERLRTGADGITLLAGQLRALVAGTLDASEEEILFGVSRFLQEEDADDVIDALIDAAFVRYTDEALPEEVARALYGEKLLNSVTRIEKFAACCYAHFLQYGLRLSERGEFTWSVGDLGNVFHGVLEQFGRRLQEDHIEWTSFTEDEGREILDETLTAYAKAYGSGILYSDARFQAMVPRIRRILMRTILSLQYQLKKGRFAPAFLEMKFQQPFGEGLELYGRVDRVDLAREGDEVFVKIIDFKSGQHAFDVTSLYYGLQLQLILYLNVVRGMQEMKHPDKKIVPAAVMYYHVQDPMQQIDGTAPPEKAEADRRKAMMPSGIINSDETVLGLLDTEFTDASDVIPVKRNKNGSLAAHSKVMAAEDLETVSAYVEDVIRESAERITAGEKCVNPYEWGDRSACRYCAYRSVCGLDPAIPGYEMRPIETLKTDDVMERIRNGEHGV